VSDLPTWARALLYAAGAIATAVVLYAVIYFAVRAALRSHFAEQREAHRRQEDLLKTIATAAEYVADVADAWAEGEAERRAAAGLPASPPPPDHDNAGSGQRSD
jgi:cbb3-type cytochrome oxidase subunit 3